MDSSTLGNHSSGVADGSLLKRKLSTSAEDRPNAPVPPPAPANVTPSITAQINYLVRTTSELLKLPDGDPETFRAILENLDAYEGVLKRSESIAAHMGAKLVGPLIMKALEKLFQGSITVRESSYIIEKSPVTWPDVVLYARNNPGTLTLSEISPGIRACRFFIKGGQVEICEDDYRLIMSGAPEKMIPTTPIADDEATELSTLNILESRLAILIKKADTVASKARQLNYHLKGRKSAIAASTGIESDPQAFSTVNGRASQPPTTELARQQAQLYDHYLALDRRSSLPQIRPKAAATGRESEARRSPQTDSTVADHNRATMAKKIEKLPSNAVINPPCDRCRRINQECLKHMTACKGCTRKHARCSWDNVKEGELDGSQVTMAPQQVSTPQQQPNPTPRAAASENGSDFGSPDLFARGPSGGGRGFAGPASRTSSPDLFAGTPIGRGRGGSISSSSRLFAEGDSLGRGRGGSNVAHSALSTSHAARPEHADDSSEEGTVLAEIASAAAAAGSQQPL